MKYRTFETFTVSLSELARLLGKSQGCIWAWYKNKGLPRQPDGMFCLPVVLRWLIQFYENNHKTRVKFNSLTQEQLADLLGVTRQTLTAWGRARLSKNRNGTYDMKQVCHWLRKYYQNIAERKYKGRLKSLQRKLDRNVRQLLRFIKHENSIIA